MKLKEKVKETIQKYGMLSSGDKVLIAVSGGPDSVALLYLLGELRDEMDLRLEVAHLGHGIRGEAAEQDALFVARTAEHLALPFHLREVNLSAQKLKTKSGNLEQMAREERLKFLAATASARGIDKIATGHTRQDQVETLLMWLLRGSGRRGLGGMPPVRQLPGREASPAVLLIRPLIEVSRAEIEEYLAAKGLEYRIDSTNLDSRLLRNWIRLELLPQLRERIDSRVDERLAHLSELLREEEVVLDQATRDGLHQVVKGQSLMVGPFLKEGRAMQRRLLRLWLQGVTGSLRAIGFDHVENALEFLTHGPLQGRLSIPRGWELVKEYEMVSVEKEKRLRKPICYSYTLPREGEVVIQEAGLKIVTKRSSLITDVLPDNDSEAFFDTAALVETLSVRNFRNGDRFQPLGMQGHKKLKDLFIEKRVPLSIRRTLPLLVADSEILWIPGHGRSEIAKIGPGTREILRVEVAAIIK